MLRNFAHRSLAAASALAVTLVLIVGTCATPARAITTEALLDTLEHTGVMYFWNEANPANGMVKDRSTAGSVSSIASTGFGLSALCIGVDRGWLTRDQVRTRVLTTLNTFWTGPQGPDVNGMIGYKGLYYHWLDMNTARRTWDSELSTIDTALLFAGILDARQFFLGTHPDEVMIRALADSITWRADWNYMRNNPNNDLQNTAIKMGWDPVTGFSNFGNWIGYNEAMIMYIIALGSPTHPVPPNAWNKWLNGYQWQTLYGQTYIIFPPLFGHQYSHCWVDFRYIQDAYCRFRGITYFENSRRATLAQREYCTVNPNAFFGYSDSLWGLTASDDPFGYAAHGAPPPQSDNGTITPTAGISSLPFAPEVCLPLMNNLWENWRATTWGPYGFKDAFNPGFGWVATDYLGIDQGPIVLMIENYRTGAVWNRMMANEDILRGLTQAAFLPLPNTGVDPVTGTDGISGVTFAPNPTHGSGTLHYRLAHPGRITVELYDVRGRHVARLFEGVQEAGDHSAPVAGDALSPGIYHLRITSPTGSVNSRFVRVR